MDIRDVIHSSLKYYLMSYLLDLYFKVLIQAQFFFSLLLKCGKYILKQIIVFPIHIRTRIYAHESKTLGKYQFYSR